MFRIVHQFKSSPFLNHDEDADENNFVRMAARGIHDNDFKSFMTMNIPHEDDYDRQYMYKSHGWGLSQNLDDTLRKSIRKSYHHPQFLTSQDKSKSTKRKVCECEIRGVLKVCQCNVSPREFRSTSSHRSLENSDNQSNNLSEDISVHGCSIPVTDSNSCSWSLDDIMVKLNKCKCK